MTDALTRGRTIRQRTHGNPLDPNDGEATMVKPAELIDLVELTPLTLTDRRSYNLLLVRAWDRIGEDIEHNIPKAVLRGAHESNDRLTDIIRRLMAAQVEVRIIRDGKRYRQSIHLLETVERPEDEAEDGNVYYRFPAKLRDIIQRSDVFARLHTQVIFCFTSKYGLSMYEMVQKRGNLKYKHEEEFTPEELRKLLGVPKGKLIAFNHFRQKALIPAVDEVNEFSDYNVRIEADHHGRKVTKLHLSWSKKDDQGLRATYARIQAHRAYRASMSGRKIIADIQAETGKDGRPMLKVFLQPDWRDYMPSLSIAPTPEPPAGPNGI